MSGSTRVPEEVSPVGAECWHGGSCSCHELQASTRPSSHAGAGDGLVPRVCRARAEAGAGWNSQLTRVRAEALELPLRELGAGLQSNEVAEGCLSQVSLL